MVQTGIEEIRHSLAHLLAAVVQKHYPTVKFGVGPAIDNGFYYDFLFPEGAKIGDEQLVEFEEEMRQLIAQDLPFSGKRVSASEAQQEFHDQPFKIELISELEGKKEEIFVYKTGEVFSDLCRGGHVKSTKEIPADAFKLTRIAGAYWKGDEKREMLTRMYGVAFASKDELEEYLKMREEAVARDHKKLGRELDLFCFSDLVGAGLPLFTPRGTVVRDLLDSYVWKLRKERGYMRVDIPHLAKKELYETSGHWDKFQDELFRITTREGHDFALKPMNCPHHVEIFRRKKWSYRELPQRYASTTKCYRDEQTGELSGIARARAFTQDDAHVFCRYRDVEEEAGIIWDIVSAFYGTFAFPLSVRLSLHDPDHMEQYLGDAEAWERAESILRSLVKKRGVSFDEVPGEAAFYGPKVDFISKDSLGREWQVATIQLDLNMSERFGLSCINEGGKEERIAMLHAAIMGSIERFLSVLIEHYAGAFPAWLSPVQVAVVPVGEKHKEYAAEVVHALDDHEIRVELHDTDETLGKRIRAAETMKVPYIAVVGDKEMKAKEVAIRQHGKGDVGTQSLDVFIEELQKCEK
jgi:threonyl-tRNA synthetase